MDDGRCSADERETDEDDDSNMQRDKENGKDKAFKNKKLVRFDAFKSIAVLNHLVGSGDFIKSLIKHRHGHELERRHLT